MQDPSGQHSSVYRAFRWTQSGGMIPLAGVPTDMWYTTASGVSADGRTVVGHVYPSTMSFRWVEAGGLTDLGWLYGQYYTIVRALSADGSVAVGDSIIPTSREAWRWTASEGMVGLGDLPGGDFHSNAKAISADGTTVVGWSRAAEGDYSFRWTAGEGMVGLGDLPGGEVNGYATDVSGDGSVVVGASESATGWEAFIWDAAHGMRSLKTALEEEYGLDLSGWSLRRAEGISDDGMVIVGEGVNPLGFDEVWVVTLPEPSIATVLMVGAVLGARRGRRSHVRTFR